MAAKGWQARLHDFSRLVYGIACQNMSGRLFRWDEEPATPREPKPVPVPAAAKRTGARRPGFDGAAGIKTNMRRFARKFGTAKERQQAIADNARLNGTDARTYAVAGATG